jgi:hypothetical protein
VNCKKQQKQFTLQGHQVRTYKTTNQFEDKDNPTQSLPFLGTSYRQK